MLDGTKGKAPIANVFLKSPCFTGELEVSCIEKPLYDVIVGNVPGVRDKNDANTGREVTREKIELIQEEDSICKVNAVTTRLQAKKMEEPFKELRVVPSLDFDITVTELRQAQREDLTLKKLWDIEASKETIRYCKGTVATFEQAQGILCRKYVDEVGRSVKQIIVPIGMRRKVLSLAHDSILTGHLGMKQNM